jgi:NAD(P)-dependent dehydrogenase (short-subunit alcohol dehydrogenase family)
MIDRQHVGSAASAPQTAGEPATPGFFDLSGKTAVVTGGARGLGAAAAAAFAAHGADVVLFDILDDGLDRTVAELQAEGQSISSVRGDVTRAADIDRLRQAADEAGGADILVNAAGVQRRRSAIDTTLDDLEYLWSVNVRGVFAVTQSLLPGMLERGHGKIINLGSLGCVLGLDRRTAYAMTKGAVCQYTQSLAVEVSGRGICVNAVAPGYIESEMTADWLHDDAEREQRLLSRILVGRFGQPEDVTGAFVFLAARASDYITGQTIVVDGGWSSW